MDPAALRPLERTVVRLADSGMSPADIAWRFRRSPRHIQRILELTRIPRSPQDRPEPGTLRPIERCILNARERGTETSEIAARLRRSPDYVERVTKFAHYKLEQEERAS